MMPTPMKEHSLFQSLPNGFDNLTAAVNRSGQEAFLFAGSNWILWDLAKGSYGASLGDHNMQRMGPGGHPWWSKCPAPFNKHLNAVVKLSDLQYVLISRKWWLKWDLQANLPQGKPDLLSNGLFANMEPSFQGNVDSAVEIVSRPGMAFIFSSHEYVKCKSDRGSQRPWSIFRTICSIGASIHSVSCTNLSVVQRHHSFSHRQSVGNMLRGSPTGVPVDEQMLAGCSHMCRRGWTLE